MNSQLFTPLDIILEKDKKRVEEILLTIKNKPFKKDNLKYELDYILNTNPIFPTTKKRILDLFNDSLKKSNNQIPMYDDPVEYPELENGKYYKIYKKTTNRPKVVAQSIFRMKKRNNRLPEYFSGLLCEIKNFHNIYDESWCYRLYIDDNILRKNEVVVNEKHYSEHGTHYSYDGLEEKNKWASLFENKDEGEIFNLFLDQVKDLPHVEIFKVELTLPELIDEDGYVVGLFGTNFRFHASLDKTKELVLMKDVDFALSKLQMFSINKYENSDKKIMYLHLPNYKPPSHFLVQYPFNIIAYLWGIKPKTINFSYDFDSIINYFINFNDSKEKFIDRKKSNNFIEKAAYGSDEIILTDLIFSSFNHFDCLPFKYESLKKWNFLFLIFYAHYSAHPTLKNRFFDILNSTFNEFKNNQIELDDWNLNDLNSFIGFNSNNKKCLLAGIDKLTVDDLDNFKSFFVALFEFNYKIFNDNNLSTNLRESYLEIMFKKFSEVSLLNLSTQKINETIFSCNLSLSWPYNLLGLTDYKYSFITKNLFVDIPDDMINNFFNILFNKILGLENNYLSDLFNKFNSFEDLSEYENNIIRRDGDYKKFNSCNILSGGYNYNLDLNNFGGNIKIIDEKYFYEFKFKNQPIYLNNSIKNIYSANISNIMTGGDPYKNKYLKYKAKYLKLKNKYDF